MVDLTKNAITLLDSLAQDERFIIVRSALGADSKLYFVGGCVRDAAMGLAPQDIDLATVLAPDEVRRRLERAGIRVAPTGLKHQTVLAVPIVGADGIEITTFRTAHMRPEGGVLQSNSIEEDLHYRDFTINAIAYDPRENKLIDPCAGLGALQRKTIAAVGDCRERFREDPLRAIRMVRFACALQFEIEPETLKAAHEFCEPVRGIAIERIRLEFDKIICSPQPARGLQLLYDLGVLPIILPEIARFVGFEQNDFHQWDLFTHTLHVVEGTEPQRVLRLAALFHDVGKPDTLSIGPEDGNRHFYLHDSVGAKLTEEILTRFRYPNETVAEVVTLVKLHMRPLSAGSAGLRRLLRDCGELYPTWRNLKIADTLATKVDPEIFREELAAFDQNIEKVQTESTVHPFAHLAISGRDLIELGLEPGPSFGDILRALHEKVLDDPTLNTKETLLRLVSEIKV